MRIKMNFTLTVPQLIAIIGTILCFIVATVKLHEVMFPTDEAEQSKEALYTSVEMNVSAYCPCAECCGRFADGITASGVPADGKLIAAPKKYAFGTRMDVPGYGSALVLDRGGLITDNRIDLLFPTHQGALNWGRQNLLVKVWK